MKTETPTSPKSMTVEVEENTRHVNQSDVFQRRKELDFGGNASLKSLVETMHETGRFEVFRVSKGTPNIFNPQGPIVSFWADAESARALSNLLIDELGRSNIPGNLWCLDVGFPRVLPHRVVGHLRCCKFDEDAKSFWKSVWRFILKRQEVDRDFSILREFVVLNFQKGNQIEHRKNESHDQHD